MTTISTKLSEKDYVNVCFVFLLNKVAVKVLLGFYLFIFFAGTISSISLGFGSFSSYFPILIMVAIIPGFTFFSAKKNFSANRSIGELTTYSFLENVIDVTRETSKSSMAYSNLYKVTRKKNWLLLWHNKQVANAIPIRDVTEMDIFALREIFSTHQIKNNL